MNFKKYVKYIPFLIFLIILLCYHWKLAVVTADYPTFQTIVSKHPLLSLTKNGFLSYRYATWSSRSLIEFNVGVLVSVPTEIWRILDSVIFTAIAVLLSKLLANNNESPFFYNCLACLFVGLFILTFSKILESAGWLATTTNYIWPICFILIHFYLLKEFIFKNKDISKFKRTIIYLILIITLLEAISSEQLLVMVGGAYLFAIVYCLYKKIEIPKLIYLFIIIILFNFIYDFCCPGNINRVKVVTKLGFPDYANFNIINKLDVGINYFLSWILMAKDLFSVIFLALLGFYTYLISNKKKITIITLIPCLAVLFFASLRFANFTTVYSYFDLTNLKHGLLSLGFIRMLSCGVMYLIITLIPLYSIYLIYKDNKKLGYFIFVLLILGFGSVIISGFTPSLTSDGRIYLNYLFVMIILDYLLVDKILEFKNKN
ncbi:MULTISPECIES: DUF6056 family protein [Methanobrevibacter]|jgi:hypothetical protein|uniref:Uncharacterized protein n=1 Tax=Methanobrevibacter smithii (strain ATCC 35061 / DSM 861 / OCM 144 / PS) TaxID=420247 RepID=A5UKM2_METS3|nr:MULTISPECIES: DUF6056 family protein [Methanobrevibacter]ABQ86750.1 conserved hypothetical protein Msm_0545 [Methanobrevibacter smithii ATCC 35061]OED02392.1 hypothetical protein A9757_06970 [Methanobrevibacter sp. A54]